MIKLEIEANLREALGVAFWSMPPTEHQAAEPVLCAELRAKVEAFQLCLRLLSEWDHGAEFVASKRDVARIDLIEECKIHELGFDEECDIGNPEGRGAFYASVELNNAPHWANIVAPTFRELIDKIEAQLAKDAAASPGGEQ